jgi:hypothetical protein
MNDEFVVGAPQWPDPPAKEAYYGLAGDVVRTIGPHTEASPVALLIQTHVCFGNVIGRNAFFTAEASQHFPNLYVVLVGVTSMGRKGSSWAQVKKVFDAVDPEWAKQSLKQGLSSGEGLTWAVRDPITKLEPIREKGTNKITGDYQDVKIDAGISDKRLLVIETEFASPLQVMAREGNTLSVVMRQAWDTGNLNTMTKNSPATATGAHVSIVGHITRDELRRELSTTEMGNGFANRFIWVCTVRSKELPEGGNLKDADLAPLVDRLKDAVLFAETVGEMKRDPAIKGLWAKTYHELTEGRQGLYASVTSRAAAQTMRLACIYALLDKSAVVRKEHLLAAVALWKYCQDSARFIFGAALGEPVADTILQGLQTSPAGLNRTEISELFKRHKTGGEISNALSLLREYGLAKLGPPAKVTDGRPPEVWVAVGSANEPQKQLGRNGGSNGATKPPAANGAKKGGNRR